MADQENRPGQPNGSESGSPRRESIEPQELRNQLEDAVYDFDAEVQDLDHRLDTGMLQLASRQELQAIIRSDIDPLYKAARNALRSYRRVADQVDWQDLSDQIDELSKRVGNLNGRFPVEVAQTTTEQTTAPEQQNKPAETAPLQPPQEEVPLDEKISRIELHPKVAQRIEQLILELNSKLSDPTFDPSQPYGIYNSAIEGVSIGLQDFQTYFNRTNFDEETYLLMVELNRRIEKNAKDLIDALNKKSQQIEGTSLIQWYGENGGRVGALLELARKQDTKNRKDALTSARPLVPAEIDLLKSELQGAQAELTAIKGNIDPADPLLKRKTQEIEKSQQEIEALLAEIDGDVTATQNQESEKNAVKKAIEDYLDKKTNQSNFSVDSHGHNDIAHDHDEALKMYSKLGYEDKELKEKIHSTFYKIYRRILLSEVETAEAENRKPDFTNLFEAQFLKKMQNIVEDITGVKLMSVDQMVEEAKSHGHNPQDVYKNLKLSQEHLDHLYDFEELRADYIARKFLTFSWLHMHHTILGKDSRDYPKDNDEDNNPVVFKIHQLLRHGLTHESMGKTTNPVLEKDRVERVISPADPNQREEVKFDSTVFGETFRVLDNWVLNRVKFIGPDGKDFRPGQMHMAIDHLIEQVHHYLRDKYHRNEGLDPNVIDIADVRRAVRLWSITTFNFSARSATSAEGSDTIYYRHKFVEYNAKYIEQGTVTWYPLITEMLFGLLDENGKKINPLHYIWGDHPEVAKHRTLIQRTIGRMAPQGFKNMKSVMERKGYLDENSPKAKERMGVNKLASYGFLLSPLITLTEYGQTDKWIEKKPNPNNPHDTYKKVLVDRNGDPLAPGEAPVKVAEEFTIQPMLANLFLRKPNGEAIRYPNQYNGNGELVGLGKPVSFLDFQDEDGQILYETLPWEKNSLNINSNLNSLQKNAGHFLNNFIKSKDVVKNLQDPTAVADFKNNFKYVLRHLPGLGIDIAAGIPKSIIDEWPELKDLEQIMMNMLIAQLVFTVCIIQSDAAQKEHWGMNQVHEYLISLVNRSKAIDKYTAEAIYDAINAAGSIQIAASNISNQLYKNLQSRFKYD